MSSARTQAGEPIGRRVLGARGQLAGSLEIAALERGLRRGEVGVGEVAFAAVGHRKLGVSFRRFRLARDRGAQQTDRFFGEFRIVGGDQRLRQHDLDQRIFVRKLRRLTQRRDSLGRPGPFEQRLAFEFMEIRIVRLRLDQCVDLFDRLTQI